MTTFKNVLISGVVALVVVVGAFMYVSHSQSGLLGYSQSNPGEFPEGIKNGTVGERYFPITIPLGSNQGSYRNTSGRVQYVDLAFMRTSATATTTAYRIVAGTSTSPTFDSYTVPTSVTNFISANLATSSLATTTNSAQGPGAGIGDGAGVIALQPSEYFNWGVVKRNSQLCTGTVCEEATSTNRGFTIDGSFHVLQTKP